MRALRRLTVILVVLLPVLTMSSASMGQSQAGENILVFGDSLTAGFGLRKEAAFPAQLQTRLWAAGLHVRVINGGISGDTTTGGLSRLDRALAEKPRLVVLELGANDALRGVQPYIVFANLDAMIRKIRAAGAKTLLAGMRAPTNWGEEYRAAFDHIYPELAQKHQVPLYPFFLQGVARYKRLNQPDGLHPNEQGVMTLVDQLAPIVLNLMQHPM